MTRSSRPAGKKRANATSWAVCLLPYLPLWKTDRLERCGVSGLSVGYRGWENLRDKKHHSYSGRVTQKSTFSLDADWFCRHHRAIGIAKFIKLPLGLQAAAMCCWWGQHAPGLLLIKKQSLESTAVEGAWAWSFSALREEWAVFSHRSEMLLWFFAPSTSLPVTALGFDGKRGSVECCHSTAHPTGLATAAPLPAPHPFCNLTARGEEVPRCDVQ